MTLHLNYTHSGCKPFFFRENGDRVQLSLCLKFHYVDVIGKDGKHKGYAEIKVRTEQQCQKLAEQWYDRNK